MHNKGTIVLTVLMAGKYKFTPGKKIHVYKNKDLYYVSSNQIDFGLVKGIAEGTLQDIEGLHHFDGIVKEIHPESCLMKVMVHAKSKGKKRRCRK